MVNIAILGYGTVGSGVYEVLNTNKEYINKKADNEVNVKYVLDLRDFPGDPVEKILVHDFDVILNDPEVKIVVEVMGGVEPAYTFVKNSILAGKSVCTSNKELVAKHGPELLSLARERELNFLFEASVGGGIPIIRPLNSSLTADEILEITGILNGTTNFILSKMSDEGWEFDDALKEAQRLGYAEKNPEADIEGFDACRKIAILSSLAYGDHVDFEDIYTEGISKITAKDIKYAKKMNRGIKLLASSKRVDDKYYAMVAPFMVPISHPLYPVSGVFNAIFVKGKLLGDVMFYGSGAGKLPTASAVVSDIVDAVKHLNRSIFTFWSSSKLSLTNVDNASRRFFVRLKGSLDHHGRQLMEVFDNVETYTLSNDKSEFGFVTSYMSEAELKEKLSGFDEILNIIRLED